MHRDLQTLCIKSFVRLIKKELIHANRNKHGHMVPLEGVFLPRHPLQFPWCCIPSAHASSASFPHWSKPTNSYRQDDWLLMWSSYSMPCSVRASEQCSIQFTGACKSLSMHVLNHENVGVKYKLRIRGPGCVEKKCAKREEKYKQKIF